MGNIAEFITTIKLSKSDRIRNALILASPHLKVAICELINTGVEIGICLLETHRTYVNQVKLGKAANEMGKQAADEFKEMFDTREPWKKEHDKEYGEES